jgi:hypothetical protein
MSVNATSFCKEHDSQPLIPMSLTANHPETTLSQRRGKIARLPRAVREQLNIRLDDGQEAAEILPWLNDLPEVRQAMTQHFNGSTLSPQNLSAWRQGGFQEWLLHRQLFDSASHMREHVGELQEVLNSEAADGVPHTLADYMVTQLSVRFAAFMGHWDGTPVNAQLGTLLKIGQFLLKLQQAAYRAEREALELPRLRRQAAREHEAQLEMAAAWKEFCAEQVKEEDKEKSRLDAKAKIAAKRKAPVRTSRKAVQSSSIKVNQGSRANQGSRPESTEPTILEHVEFGQGSRHPSSSSQTSPPSFSSADHEKTTLISPLKT